MQAQNCRHVRGTQLTDSTQACFLLGFVGFMVVAPSLGSHLELQVGTSKPLLFARFGECCRVVKFVLIDAVPGRGEQTSWSGLMQRLLQWH